MQQQHLELIFAAWRGLAGFDDGFRSPGLMVKTRNTTDSADTWISVVRLVDSVLVSVPGSSPHLSELSSATVDLADPRHLRAIVGKPREQLGPAQLFFFDPDHRGALELPPTATLPPSDPEIVALLDDCDAGEMRESGLQRADSKVSVVRRESEAVAAAGWETWGNSLAHMCVLTHPDQRHQGLGYEAAVDATRRAVETGLVPQWRARRGNDSSAALARRIGYELLGRQLSFRI